LKVERDKVKFRVKARFSCRSYSTFHLTRRRVKSIINIWPPPTGVAAKEAAKMDLTISSQAQTLIAEGGNVVSAKIERRQSFG